MRRSVLAVLVIVVAGCARSHVLDDDAGAIACAPIVSGEVYLCPSGCMAVLGRAVLEPRACIGRESTVLACYPSGLPIRSSGDVACFERPSGAYRVWSSAGSVFVADPLGRPSPELITSQGWSRTECANELTGETLAPCPI